MDDLEGMPGSWMGQSHLVTWKPHPRTGQRPSAAPGWPQVLPSGKLGVWLLNWPPPGTTGPSSCRALPWAHAVHTRLAEAEGWQDAGTLAPNPDSHLQTFARERLNVFPNSATHCPLLAVNLAHFIRPEGVHIPAPELTEPRRTVAVMEHESSTSRKHGCVLSRVSGHFGQTCHQGRAFQYKYLRLRSGLCISLGTPILPICARPGFPSRRFSGEGDWRNPGGLMGTPIASAEVTQGLCGALR